MRIHQKEDPHLAKRVLAKTSSVLAGQKEPIFQEPFALSRLVAFREMLVNVILPSQGKKLEQYPNVKQLIETGIKISSHYAVSKTSEESKFNLKTSPYLTDTEEGDVIEIEI